MNVLLKSKVVRSLLPSILLQSTGIGLAAQTVGVVVSQPSPLYTGSSVVITGTESDATKRLFLDWRTSGVPALNASDWVQANVQTNGSFSAALVIDHPGTKSTLYYRIENGPAKVAWAATPSAEPAPTPTPVPKPSPNSTQTPTPTPLPPKPTVTPNPVNATTAAPSVNRVSVLQPSPLVAGSAVTLHGTESDATASIFLNWRTTGIPAANDSGWVQASTQSDGSFSAALTIDHPGTASTLFYRIGTGSAQVAWKAIPVASAVPTPPPLNSSIPPSGASLNYVGNLPASLPNISFHLTARPWSPINVSPDEYLDRLEGEARYWSHHQDATGNLIDPYLFVNHDYSTPFYAYAVGTLIKAGRAQDLLSSGTLAMEKATSSYATGGGSEFFIYPLAEAIELYRTHVSAATLATWSTRMQQGVNLGNTNNWRTYYMAGNWARAGSGLISTSSAISEIELDWNSNQTSRIASTTWNLYHDLTTSPDTLAVEGVGRGNLVALSAMNYNGPSATKIKTTVERGSLTSLLMQDPSGQAPVNGRTDNHIWVDIANQSIFENLAEMSNREGNLWLAGQYRRAAYKAFSNVSRWQRPDGTFYITKNHFDPSLRIGYQPTSQFDTYNGSVMFHTAESYNARQSQISENPSPTEIGGYAMQLDSTFAAAFANAGGMAVEIDLKGQISTSFDSLWTVLGIVRLGKPDWDTRLGPSDGQRDPTTGVGVSFAPTWFDGTKWTLLGSHASTYAGTFSTALATPALTIARVVWAPTAGNSGPSFQQDLTITPDGVLSKVSQIAGAAVPLGMTYPLLKSDGSTTLTQTISNRIASVSFPNATDEQNFILINTQDAALVPGGASVRNGFGDLSPIRATSSDSVNTTYVYPRSAGDLPAAQVRDSFHLTPDGFVSSLGRLVGTVYIGQTSGGGYGDRLDIGGNGNPDVLFDQKCNFIVQIKNQEVTAIETDRQVTVTVSGVSTTLPAYYPLKL